MAKPPCILFLLDWRPVFWSTREEFYRQLCCELAQRGVTPILTISEEVTGDVRQRFEEAGAQIVPCSYHAQPRMYWTHIRRAVRQYEVQAAHVRFFDYFTAVFWMCRLAGIRTVLFTEANSGEMKSRGWTAALLQLRTRVMCVPLVKVTAISRFIRERLIAVGIPAERICVIYNGVDISSFRPDSAARDDVRREAEVASDTVVLVFAAVFLPWKRPEVILRVCAELLRRGKPAALWMAGDGPLRQELQALAKDLGIDKHVRWLGYQREPQRWFAAADIFVHAAVGEAFGNVLVEAMACGLPVVATRSGAAPELIPDPQVGRLVPSGPEEVAAFADAIEEVAGDSARYRQMSQQAIRQAERFPVAKCVRETLALYESLK